MAVIAASNVISGGHLRPIDVGHDLNAVADLIELCFSNTLDPEGHQYLNHIRDAAQSAPLLGWATTLGEPPSVPLTGYVWEEEGQLVGNVSVIPFYHHERRYYLIANVAVHPHYRGRGIARILTESGIEHARQHRAPAVWLQVREDNDPALHIYRHLGFQERARRTAWHSHPQESPSSSPLSPADFFKIGPRLPHHWSQQIQWLERLYPSELSWHLPIDRKSLQPGLMAEVYRFFNFNYPKQWVITREGELFAVLACCHTSGYADTLWLAAPPLSDDYAIHTLLRHARQHAFPLRPLMLNYPAGLSAQAIQSAGFQAQQTLIWMSIQFDTRS